MTRKTLDRFIKLVSILIALQCWCVSISGQILDIEGDAKIRGRLEISYPLDVTSLAIGEGAGNFENESEFRNNTFVGYNAGHFNTTGKFNTVNGANALYYNQTGSHHTAIGYLALYWTGFNGTTSSYNTAAGALALTNITTGIENSALGFQAGYSNTTGRWNTFIGSQAARDLQTGDNNVFIGHACRLLGTNGSNNVIVGDSAMLINNGSNNVVLGYGAGRNLQGSNNIILGFEAGSDLTNVDNTLWIESSSSSIPLIYGDFVSNRVGIKCTNPQAALSVNGDIKAIGLIEMNQATTCFSDRRLKTNIVDLKELSKLVMKLRPVRYHWRKEAFPEIEFPEEQEIGFIAQEIEKILPGLVLTGEDGYKALDYSRMTVILTKAIQEIITENQQLRERYQKIGARIALLEATSNMDAPLNTMPNEK